ncbi:ABC transporter permease [Trinickia mobilis]|uniref:ABC transporter permease n=1 Tax=Trinickia mobilis TaxID=2816356 RepID=UPI001A8F48AA|nr:ABC transporter permease [Trinickia mobilis]
MKSERMLEASRGVLIASWIVMAFLILPIAMVLPLSLTDQAYLSLPRHGLSLSHYYEMFHSSEWLSSFAQSAVIGLCSTLIAVAAGVLCTVGCWLLGSRFATWVRIVMLLPLIVPSVIYALGIYRFYIKLDLLDSYVGVVIAHAVTSIPYVVISMTAALAGFDGALLSAARGLGANVFQALYMVVLPNVVPGMVSGAILAFMHSWDEIVIVLFIASREIFTLPRRIWDGINDQLDPTIASVATTMIVLSLLLLVAYRMLGGNGNRVTSNASGD